MYYILYFIFFLISLLPRFILYGISDFANFILFKCIKYRQWVINDNLIKSFPDLSTNEILKIREEFNKNFCDQWIETIELLSISKKQLKKRIIGNFEIFDKYHQTNTSCDIFLGHQFNWEFCNAIFPLSIKQTFVGIYMPVNNKAFDKLMYSIRSRMGTFLISAKQFREDLSKLKASHYVLGVISDQSPSNLSRAKWYEFLHQPCAFMTGPEKRAALNGHAIVYCNSIKLKRGYYKLEFSEMTSNASREIPGTITDNYVALLQKSIKAQPSNWLWSHRRWKHQPQSKDIVIKK